MFKVSQYNHFQSWRSGYYIAYNARSGAIALMPEEQYSMFNKLADKLVISPCPDMTEKEMELLKQLQYGQFVLPEEMDERVDLRFRHNMERYDQTSIGLIIAPTMACNMACKYCFEADKKTRMSPQVVESILNFIEGRAPYLKLLNVRWYGGEPLLAMDIIEDMSETFLDITREYRMDYRASMITNGYQLTPETTDRLKELAVFNVQITLDGPSRIHNIRRPLKNGKPSFDTILSNMAYAVSRMSVSIRINIDKGFSAEMLIELLKELKGAGVQDKIGLYFGHLEAITQACSNISETCYETSDFSQLEIEYFGLLLKNGFLIHKLPSPINTFCIAQTINSFLIDPNGELYCCYNHVGDISKSMGNIKDDMDFNHPNFRRLFNPNPFDEAECVACKLLPICMGGCPSRRVERGMKGTQSCESWKHNIRWMLEIIAEAKQAERQQKLTQQQERQPAVASAKEEGE